MRGAEGGSGAEILMPEQADGGVREWELSFPWTWGTVYKYPATESDKGLFKWQWLPVSSTVLRNLATNREPWSVSVTGRS